MIATSPAEVSGIDPAACMVYQRLAVRGDATLGLFLDVGGSAPLCFGLEDGPSPDPSGAKVHGRTRIPAGIYPLARHDNPGSEIVKAYRDRWGHPWAVRIDNVPGYTGVLIHTGTRAADTKGCILTGDSAWWVFGPGPKGENPRLSASRQAYKRFYEERLRPYIEGAEHPRLIIRDEPQTAA